MSVNQTALRSMVAKIKSQPQYRPGSFHPILVSDIDGVLISGSKPIAGCSEAMKTVRAIDIPFTCFTNSGGQLQARKVEQINSYYGSQLFRKDQMFMVHSPLRPLLLKESQGNKLILITGLKDIAGIMEDAQIYNYITADELYILFDEAKYTISKENQIGQFKLQSLLPISLDRLKMRFEKIGYRIDSSLSQMAKDIKSIIALNDVSPYETSLAAIASILRARRDQRLQAPIFYAAQNDYLWANEYPKSRIGFGPFNTLLKSYCQRHNLQLKHIYYGKPELKAFQFVESEMRKKCAQTDSIFFMVGDNPRADIRGANTAGWLSFLTRTGVHKAVSNDTQDPATVVVDDFKQVVAILKTLKEQTHWLQ